MRLCDFGALRNLAVVPKLLLHTVTLPNFWAINFGRRHVKIASQNFLGDQIVLERRNSYRGLEFIDPLMGLFRGAVFCHGGGPLKQPIKQPTEMPTSTLALMGRFTSLMGRFPTLMGHFTDVVTRGRFTS